MNKKVEAILNEQVSKEAYSSHLYLAMASWAENEGFSGTAQWLYVQADEERMHMLKFVRYINDRGGKAVLPEIKKPPMKFSGVKSMFEEVLKHERYISDSINEIVFLCAQEKDFTTHNWVQWFVTEQIEEETNARTILDKLKLLGETNMYLFDRDIFAMRSATPAATAGPEA
jgi:ferritin